MPQHIRQEFKKEAGLQFSAEVAILMLGMFVIPCLGQTPSEVDSSAFRKPIDEKALAVPLSKDEMNDTESAYLEIYADGNMRDDRIVEIVRCEFPKAKLHAVVLDDTLGQLLAQRGHIAALHHLLSTISKQDRDEFLRVARTRRKAGLSVMHNVVLHTTTAYWVDMFAELGVDVSMDPQTNSARTFEELVRKHQPNNKHLGSLDRYNQLHESRALEGEK